MMCSLHSSLYHIRTKGQRSCFIGVCAIPIKLNSLNSPPTIQTNGGNYAGTSMALSIVDIGSVIFGSTDNLVSYLQHRQLLADTQTCGNYGTPMNLGSKSDISDGLIFRCGICKTTKSLRAGSFFTKSKLPLQK